MNNLVSNLNYFRTLLNPNTKIMVMVKAFSYGLGTYDVAKLLEVNNADYLGVANIYEGIELRKAGIEMPIMVMKPEIELIALLKKNPSMVVESVFSHLAATDERIHDDFTRHQIAEFKDIADQLSTELGYDFDRHILNSNGIIRFNEAQMDMVRLGIGLYGVSTEATAQKHLLPASTLKSKISQIKRIPKGDTIGYNLKGFAVNDMVIATIPVGYADGLSRALGNGNWNMKVNGQDAPIVGNVCMDMVMIDVTNINCQEGDEAFVFSAANPITKMAECIGTIPYEILTSYSPRVKRVFSYQ
jgi:alanine racemase